MTNWRKKIQIKQFFTESEEYEEVKKSMNNVANVLEKHPEFLKILPSGSTLIYRMRNIPEGDDVITPVDYANTLLSMMYDIADEERIWIE